jgi:hypothetical protein
VEKQNQTNQCKACNTELSDPNWTFCSSVCADLWWQLVESRERVKMNHGFVKSEKQTDRPGGLVNCAICSRSFLDHTRLAVCDKCQSKAKPGDPLHDLFGDLLLCHSCLEETKSKQREVISEAREVLTESSKILPFNSSRQYFNAKTASLIEQRKSSESEESFVRDLASELEVLHREIFDHQEAIEKKSQELQAVRENLRAFGDRISDEFRAKIADVDKRYFVRPEKRISPKLPKAKKQTPYDRYVAMTAQQLGITLFEAEKRLKSMEEMVKREVKPEDKPEEGN